MSFSSSSVNRSTPGGCIIGLAAIFCSAFPIFGAWGLYRWFALASESRQLNAYFWTMLVALIGGGLMTLLLIVLSYRCLQRTDFHGYDPDDPSEPKVRW